MTRLYRLMEAIGHAYAYPGKPLGTPSINSGRVASTTGRPTHQPTPQSERKHQ